MAFLYELKINFCVKLLVIFWRFFLGRKMQHELSANTSNTEETIQNTAPGFLKLFSMSFLIEVLYLNWNLKLIVV